MPLPPATQLFQNTGLADNPILSAILFLQQRQQDTADRARDEEQREIENKKAEEQFKLQQKQVENQSKQIQNTLEASEINRRMGDFKFRTGTESVPEALIAGTIPSTQINDPVSTALAQVDRTGNVQPEMNAIQDLIMQNPYTGKDDTFSRQTIDSILRGEQQRQQQKMAIPLMNMQMAEKRFVLGQMAQSQRDEANRISREKLAGIAHEDRIKQMQNSKDIAAMRITGGSGSEFSNLKQLTAAGMRPTGNMAVDIDFWENLSGTDRQVLGGTLNAKDVFDRDALSEFTNNARKAGLVVPNFKAEDITKYKDQKTAVQGMVTAAENFVRTAPATFEGLGGKKFGEVRGAIAKQSNDPSVVFNDTMRGFVDTLKEITGATGVLTNQDIIRLEGMLPKYEDSPTVRKQRIQEMKNYIARKEKTFFSSIPPAQREFMFAMNGIPTGSSPETNTPGQGESDYLDQFVGGNK